MDAQEAVTDSQRVAYTLVRLNRWAENFEANASAASMRGNHTEAQRLLIQADTTRDIIKMLDGSDDRYIAQLASSPVSLLKGADTDS